MAPLSSRERALLRREARAAGRREDMWRRAISIKAKEIRISNTTTNSIIVNNSIMINIVVNNSMMINIDVDNNIGLLRGASMKTIVASKNPRTGSILWRCSEGRAIISKVEEEEEEEEEEA